MMLTKDGNPSSGVFSTESKEKITPPTQLNEEEKKLNEGNEWLQFLKSGKTRSPAIRNARLPNRAVSRSQRRAILDERHGPDETHQVSRAQKKRVTDGE